MTDLAPEPAAAPTYVQVAISLRLRRDRGSSSASPWLSPVGVRGAGRVMARAQTQVDGRQFGRGESENSG